MKYQQNKVVSHTHCLLECDVQVRVFGVWVYVICLAEKLCNCEITFVYIYYMYNHASECTIVLLGQCLKGNQIYVFVINNLLLIRFLLIIHYVYV